MTIDPIQAQLTAARREQILDAATGVFAHKGFHPATIRDIAKDAGISEGTIYNYFDNKTAILMGVFDRLKASIVETQSVPDEHHADIRSSLAAMLRHPLSALKDNNFALFSGVISEMLVNGELRRAYHDQILQPTLAMGEYYLRALPLLQERSDTEIVMLTRTISAMVMGMTLVHAMGDRAVAEHWDDLPDMLATLILDGIARREPS